MGVARRQAVAVIDLDHPAEVALEAGEGDDAAGRRGDRRAGARREVEPGVEGVRMGERIDAVAERRRQLGARDRQPRRQAHQARATARRRRSRPMRSAARPGRAARRSRRAATTSLRSGSSGPPAAPAGSACDLPLRPDGARGDAGASAFITPIRLPSCAASLSSRNRRAEIAPTCSSVNGSASGSGAAVADGIVPDRCIGEPVAERAARPEQGQRRDPCQGDQRPDRQGPHPRPAVRAGGNHHERHAHSFRPMRRALRRLAGRRA